MGHSSPVSALPSRLLRQSEAHQPGDLLRRALAPAVVLAVQGLVLPDAAEQAQVGGGLEVQLLLGPAQLLAGHLRGAAVRAAPRPRRAPGAAGAGRGMRRVPGARGRPRARADRRGCRDRSGRRRGAARAGARAGCAAGLPGPPSSEPRAGAPANRAPPPGLALAPRQCGQSSAERTIASFGSPPPSPATVSGAGPVLGGERRGRGVPAARLALGSKRRSRPVVTEREHRSRPRAASCGGKLVWAAGASLPVSGVSSLKDRWS